jgi:hypothetical protein
MVSSDRLIRKLAEALAEYHGHAPSERDFEQARELLKPVLTRRAPNGSQIDVAALIV